MANKAWKLFSYCCFAVLLPFQNISSKSGQSALSTLTKPPSFRSSDDNHKKCTGPHRHSNRRIMVVVLRPTFFTFFFESSHIVLPETYLGLYVPSAVHLYCEDWLKAYANCSWLDNPVAGCLRIMRLIKVIKETIAWKPEFRFRYYNPSLC